MKKLSLLFAVLVTASSNGSNTSFAIASKEVKSKLQLPGPVQLGLVDIVACRNLPEQKIYLQAHSDNGEMHSSHNARYTEETWELVQVDKANNIYAFINYSNGNYMRRTEQGCVVADSPILGYAEQWKLTSGQAYGFQNVYMFRSLAGYTLGVNPPGDNTFCGGEVAALGKVSPENKPTWNGWFIIESCGIPPKGPTVKDWVEHTVDIANKVAAAGKAIATLAQ